MKNKHDEGAEFVDLHVAIIPRRHWNHQLNYTSHRVLADKISAGFIRVRRDSQINSLRNEISKQIGLDKSFPNYAFLRHVAKCLVLVHRKQEDILTSSDFTPPTIEHPELLILPLDAAHSHLPHDYKITPQHRKDNVSSGSKTATRQTTIDSLTESNTANHKDYSANKTPDIIRIPAPLRKSALHSQDRDRNEYVNESFRGRGHFGNFEPDGQSSVRTRTQSEISHRITPPISARNDASQTMPVTKGKKSAASFYSSSTLPPSGSVTSANPTTPYVTNGVPAHPTLPHLSDRLGSGSSSVQDRGKKWNQSYAVPSKAQEPYVFDTNSRSASQRVTQLIKSETKRENVSREQTLSSSSYGSGGQSLIRMGKDGIFDQSRRESIRTSSKKSLVSESRRRSEKHAMISTDQHTSEDRNNSWRSPHSNSRQSHISDKDIAVESWDQSHGGRYTIQDEPNQDKARHYTEDSDKNNNNNNQKTNQNKTPVEATMVYSEPQQVNRVAYYGVRSKLESSERHNSASLKNAETKLEDGQRTTSSLYSEQHPVQSHHLRPILSRQSVKSAHSLSEELHQSSSRGDSHIRDRLTATNRQSVDFDEDQHPNVVRSESSGRFSRSPHLQNLGSVGTPPHTLGTPSHTLGTPPHTLGTPPLTIGTPPRALGTPPHTLGTLSHHPHNPRTQPRHPQRQELGQGQDYLSRSIHGNSVQSHRDDSELPIENSFIQIDGKQTPSHRSIPNHILSPSNQRDEKRLDSRVSVSPHSSDISGYSKRDDINNGRIRNAPREMTPNGAPFDYHSQMPIPPPRTVAYSPDASPQHQSQYARRKSVISRGTPDGTHISKRTSVVSEIGLPPTNADSHIRQRIHRRGAHLTHGKSYLQGTIDISEKDSRYSGENRDYVDQTHDSTDNYFGHISRSPRHSTPTHHDAPKSRSQTPIPSKPYGDPRRNALWQELLKVREKRERLEETRQVIIREAQHKAALISRKRDGSQDVWQRRYQEEKKVTMSLTKFYQALEGQCKNLNQNTETIDAEPNAGRKRNTIRTSYANEGPSFKKNSELQAKRCISQIKDMKSRLAEVKAKLATEIKVRHDVENELKSMRKGLLTKKIHTNLAFRRINHYDELARLPRGGPRRTFRKY